MLPLVSSIKFDSMWAFSPIIFTEDNFDGAPNVEAALSISPTQALAKQTPRKSTIGQRKPQSAKKGVSRTLV